MQKGAGSEVTDGGALQAAQGQIGQAPDQPGLVKSFFNLVSAILRAGGGGLQGGSEE